MSSINAKPGSSLEFTSLIKTGDGTANLTLQTNSTNALVIDSNQNANLASTGQFGVPVGTSAQRPTPTNGMLRYNTSNSSFEAYVNSTWVSYAPIIIDALVVGGGGGAAGGLGGGGGAGGVISLPKISLTPITTYTFVIGAGGSGSIGYPSVAANGTSTTAFGATAAGGGATGSFGTNGFAGGSGGGAGSTPDTSVVGGVSTGNSLGSNTGIIYGNSGASQYANRAATPTRAGGGGGAGSQANNVDCNTVNSSTSANGYSNGGAGIPTSITGSTLYFGGGGGGSAHNGNGYAGNGGIGGAGGGGGNDTSSAGLGGGSSLNSGSNGGGGPNGNGGSGGANTGGGAGGGAWQTTTGGTGGSGVVILSIPTARYSNVTTGSPTVSTSGSNTVLIFTASGSYTA